MADDLVERLEKEICELRMGWKENRNELEAKVEAYEQAIEAAKAEAKKRSGWWEIDWAIKFIEDIVKGDGNGKPNY